MTYTIESLPLQTLLPAIGRAEDQLARLDEQVRRTPVGEGFIERGHFFDAAASMWVGGELVHVEDLVLHDARMDVRAPTHELTIAHRILRARRRIAGTKPAWAVSDAGIGALTGYGYHDQEVGAGEGTPPVEEPTDFARLAEDDPFARELANVDALLEQSQRLLDKVSGAKGGGRDELIVDELVVRDPDWDEVDRLSQWKHILRDVGDLPPTLGAALLWDAWESLEPMQRQHWLGTLLVSAHLRAQGKVASHLFGFNVGLKAVPRERRRSVNRLTRLLAFLDAMTASAESGVKEIARLVQAREQMMRRLNGRRSSSSLPTTIELVLSRPIVSAPMIAKSAKVTQRAALNLIGELGVREMTGRGRYRAWGIL
ncbi:RHE_PE00001 family protein [Shinella granuli]|uniref:DNA binding protein with HTH domain n=1 Tax=Shinella granuli TaxID=323621 RepID=A0A4R2C606_SHIGR|nr:RHE_PE00001 family protein [Shinella granuli]TCN35676.1 DNA binding protein with HTH domain [Shinella granuli]